MKRTGPRTVLVALAVLAVAVGGALFPASGFGSAPADETDLIGADGPGEATGPRTDGRNTVTDAPETAYSDGSMTETAASTTVVDDGTTSTPSTPDATPTAKPTPALADGGDSGADGDGIALGLWALAGVVVAVVAVATLGGLSFRSTGGTDSGSGPSLGPFSLPWPFSGGSGGVSPAGLIKRVPQATMVALVGASTGTARLLSTTGSVASDTVSGIAAVVGGGSRAATGGLFAGIGGLLSVSGGSLLSVSGVLSGLAVGGSGGASGRAPDADARTAAAVEPESGDDPIRTVEEAWAAFAEPLPVADPEARTPGELARAAVDRGDPAEPVERLRDVFRDVRYGGAAATDDRTRTAIEAARAVLARREDEE